MAKPLIEREPRPRRFAPLKKDARDNKELGRGVRRLKGVIFDVDGTLCEPQTYMFTQMRDALSIDAKTDILAHISSLPPSEQPAAHEAIRAIERSAMLLQTPQPGLETLFTYLTSPPPSNPHHPPLPLGILTRNHLPPVTHLLSNHLPTTTFHPILTRDFLPAKPDPAGILHIAEQWGVDPREVIMVGDSMDDMRAGYMAGAATVLLGNNVNGELWEHEYTDLVITRLDELVGILEEGFKGRE
ncbi:hypothetical protein ACMFMF_002473 [Clarireedia jacksonii]